MFRVKDLLVSVIRSDEESARAAGGPSCFFQFSPGEVPANLSLLLGALKDQVASALQEIDREGEPGGQQLQPHTLAQIEMLQSNFDRAQAELNRLRAEILNET